MKKLCIIVPVIILLSVTTVNAQQRLVNEVKKEISGMNLTVDSYKNSLKKIAKTLENDETKDKAEPWWLAGRINYGIYDKMMNNKAAGEKISTTDAGKALLEGYDKFTQALSRDTIVIKDKKGNPVLDKKTGKAKVRTKYSTDIMNREVDHMIDYSAVGGDFYLAGDWDNAYKAWDIYCSIAKSPTAQAKKKNEPDSIVGYNRFFQGLAAYQGKKYDKAALCFANARDLGYRKKALYDTWIDALMKQHDTTTLVSVAQQAYDRLGAKDPRYVRILINHYLRNKDYNQANNLLNEVMNSDSLVAEYYDLKGRIVEINDGVDAALPFYYKTVELAPDYPMGLFDLGNALYTKAIADDDHRSQETIQLYEQALPYLEKAYRLMPHNSDLKKILSRIYYVTGSNKLDEL